MEAAQHQAVVDGLTRKYMDTIEKLQNEKAKLEVSFRALLSLVAVILWGTACSVIC